MLPRQYDRVLRIIVEVCAIKPSSSSQEAFVHEWFQSSERTFNRIGAGELLRKGMISIILLSASSTYDNERRRMTPISSNFTCEPVDVVDFVRNCNNIWATQTTQATTLLNVSHLEYFLNRAPQKRSFSAQALTGILSFFTPSSLSESS